MNARRVILMNLTVLAKVGEEQAEALLDQYAHELAEEPPGAPAAVPDLPDDSEDAGLFYRPTNGWDFINIAIPPEQAIADPRERELCRVFLLRALALLDATPVRPDEENTR